MKLDGRTPVSQPIYTLDDVLAWCPGNDDLCVSKVARSPRKPTGGPKTLICHDMKGGYLEDRLVQGCPKSDCYRFYHWQYVDTFVYFSHHFITIPPPTWIVPAHRHGVKVLGTLITEWDDGKRRCEAFLSSEDAYMALADKLVEISDYYDFDGWLVNIENVIEEPDHLKNLHGFVEYLTEQQHKHDATSEVIWYDSVIDTGKLDWQNEVNEKNRLFFDVCDGIFLNYCWKDENLKASKKLAVEAERPYDVYVGIDVFGRGCLGDGGFNTCEALSAAHGHDLSAALFANGWVYEKWGKEAFVQNENKFWNCLNAFCCPRSITSLPLVTTFCQGQGHRYWSEGKAIMGPWYNQSVQQLQPSFTHAQFNCENFSLFTPVMEPYMQEAFNGGNSMKLGGKIAKGQSLQFKLFSLDIDMNSYCEDLLEGSSSLYVSFTYKPLQNVDSGVCLQLELKQQSDTPSNSKPVKTIVILPSTPKDSFHTSPPKPEENTDVAVIFETKLSEVPPQIKSTGSDQECQDVAAWKTSYFEIGEQTVKNSRLTEVAALVTSHSQEGQLTTILLGEIKIIPLKSIPDSFPSVSFGETVYHDTKPLSQYIEAENNRLDRGVTEEEKNEPSKKNEEDSDNKEKTSQTATATDNDAVSASDNDIVKAAGNDVVITSDCVLVSAADSDTGKTTVSDTVKATHTDTAKATSNDIVKATDSDTVVTGDSDTVVTGDSDIVKATESNTVNVLDIGKVNAADNEAHRKLENTSVEAKDIQSVIAADSGTMKASVSDTVQCRKSGSVKCKECFTLQWRVSNPDKVQYYRVFQDTGPFGSLQLLGLTVLPAFKVTGFVVQSTEGNKSKTEINSMGDNLAMTGNLSEAKFRCTIQPVLVTGNAVPIDMCKANIKSEIFRLEDS